MRGPPGPLEGAEAHPEGRRPPGDTEAAPGRAAEARERASAPAPRDEADPTASPAASDPLETLPPEPVLDEMAERVAEKVEDVRQERKRKKKKKAGKGKEGGTLGSSRGIETMFRTSYRTHVDLSGLADNKANIMISINGIIISIIIATVAPEPALSRGLLFPAAALVLGCVTSMIFAVLAARPRLSRRTISLQDVRDNRANILFFGNFVNMSEADYVEGMKELMANTDRLYVNMVRDLYSLGLVLQKKFRLLRVSYTVFMVGLVGGVLLFLVFLVMTPGSGGPGTALPP